MKLVKRKRTVRSLGKKTEGAKLRPAKRRLAAPLIEPKPSPEAAVKEIPRRRFILVAEKPVKAYVAEVHAQFAAGSDEVILKAMGENISKASDVAEIVTKNVLKNLVVVKSTLKGTERLQSETGLTERPVIEIILGPKPTPGAAGGLEMKKATGAPEIKKLDQPKTTSKVLVDGSNVIFYGRKLGLHPPIKNLQLVIGQLEKEGYQYIVFVDPRTRHHIRNEDTPVFEQMISYGTVQQVPATTVADRWFLEYATNHPECKVLSNDTFGALEPRSPDQRSRAGRNWKDEFPWVVDQNRFIRFMIINDEVYLEERGAVVTATEARVPKRPAAGIPTKLEHIQKQIPFLEGQEPAVLEETHEYQLAQGFQEHGPSSKSRKRVQAPISQKPAPAPVKPKGEMRPSPKAPEIPETKKAAEVPKVEKLDPEAVLALRNGEHISFGKWSAEPQFKVVLSEFWDGGDNVRRLVEMINYYLDFSKQGKFVRDEKELFSIGGEIGKDAAIFHFEDRKQPGRFLTLVNGAWQGIKGYKDVGVSLNANRWGKYKQKKYLQKKFQKDEIYNLNWLPDCYHTLRVSQTASAEEIEGAFVLAVRALIPGAEGGAKELLKITGDKEYIGKTCDEKARRRILKCGKAYLTLSDEKKRAEYDEKLKRIREIFLDEVKRDSFRFLCLGGTGPGGCISFFVKVGGHHAIFDAGFDQGRGTVPPFEILKDLPEVEAVFLSHAHADHIGTLPLLLRYIPKNVPVFATVGTLKTAEKTMLDSLRQTEKEKGEPIFSGAELKNALARIKLVEYNKTYEHNGMRFVAGNAGHVPGSAMFLVEADGDSVMYTGDFSVERTRTEVPAKPFGKKPDLMICEATYAGVQEREERGEREAELVRAIRETIERGGRALVPCFAIGRTREVMSIIDAAIERKDLPEIPVYAVGLGAYLEDVWKWRHVERLEGDWYEFWKTKKSRCVVIAGSGTLDKGMSSQFLLDVAGSKKDSVIGVGYSPRGSTIDLLRRAKNGERVVLDRDFKPKCEIYEVKLSAHAGGEEIVEFILNQAPRNLIVVHTENPDGIIENEHLRSMRPLAPWQFNVVRRGNSYGIYLKPKPWEVGGKPVECECGKVFDNIRIASWHAEREGHRLKGIRRVVFFRYEVLEEGEPIGSLDVINAVKSNLNEYAEKVAAFCMFPQGAKAPNLRRLSEDEMEKAMRAVGSADKKEPARSRMLQAAMKSPATKKEFEDLVADVKKAVGIRNIFVRGQSFEIQGGVHPSFSEYLEKRMDRIWRSRVRVKMIGEKAPHMEVASPANLPMFMLTEIDQVQKLLGCKIEAPRYRYMVLEPGMSGLYRPEEALLLVSSDLKANAELLAVAIDHELAHHAQYTKNKRLREACERVGFKGELEFVEGFAQWATRKLKNCMWLVEVPERTGAKYYFEGARLFEDIEAAFGEEKAVEAGLCEDQNGFLKVAEKAGKELASKGARALKSGFDVLKSSGIWKRDVLHRERMPPREMENMLELIREKAADMHQTRYAGWSPEVVARDAALQIVAEEAVRRAGGGDTFKAKKAWEYKLMKGREELLEEMAKAYVSALKRAMKTEEAGKKKKVEGVTAEAEMPKREPAVREVPRRKEPPKGAKTSWGTRIKPESVSVKPGNKKLAETVIEGFFRELRGDITAMLPYIDETTFGYLGKIRDAKSFKILTSDIFPSKAKIDKAVRGLGRPVEIWEITSPRKRGAPVRILHERWVSDGRIFVDIGTDLKWRALGHTQHTIRRDSAKGHMTELDAFNEHWKNILAGRAKESFGGPINLQHVVCPEKPSPAAEIPTKPAIQKKAEFAKRLPEVLRKYEPPKGAKCCNNCGMEIPARAKFCPICGVRQSEGD